jgi:hypothetical protein
MAINGRINVDVLFHDTDGTTSLKVVSLEDSTEYTTGKVAVVTGTCGTASTAISYAPSTYRDASGNLVSLSSVSRIAFAATPLAYVDATAPGAPADAMVASKNNSVTVLDAEAVAFVYTTAGTASYTLVMYGT